MPPDWRLFHLRRSTAKRLFFEVPLSDSDLDIAINRSDHIAHDLLHRFLDSYQQWWQKSIELADSQLPSPAERELLVKMIDERDEIRKTLLSYLGYVRARDVVNA
jgi:hypothetical protein